MTSAPPAEEMSHPLDCRWTLKSKRVSVVSLAALHTNCTAKATKRQPNQ